MSEQANAADGEQQISIHSIFVKDVSFESPNAPQVFQETKQPTIQVELGVHTGQLGEDTHEVTLAVNVTAKTEDRTAFLVEVQQSGVFTVRGFSANDVSAILGIYCPNALFPYAREAVSSLVSKGGFPQLMLEPVNFEALYAQHMQNQVAEQPTTTQ